MNLTIRFISFSMVILLLSGAVTTVSAKTAETWCIQQRTGGGPVIVWVCRNAAKIFKPNEGFIAMVKGPNWKPVLQNRQDKIKLHTTMDYLVKIPLEQELDNTDFMNVKVKELAHKFYISSGKSNLPTKVQITTYATNTKMISNYDPFLHSLTKTSGKKTVNIIKKIEISEATSIKVHPNVALFLRAIYRCPKAKSPILSMAVINDKRYKKPYYLFKTRSIKKVSYNEAQFDEGKNYKTVKELRLLMGKKKLKAVESMLDDMGLGKPFGK